ncbi:MAG: hypothetical protein Q4F27_03555, partial [Desulfovibrionaceae bacterium]|nr:hypothetical protein [Desulfovibrionaceae bacterium]
MKLSIERNSVIQDCYTLKPVNDFSIFAGFSCLPENIKDRDLDEFIQIDAERHLSDRIAVTYAFFLRGIEYPLGFATLQNDAIFIESNDDSCDVLDVQKQYPYKWYPAVKIGRFGIHYQYHRNGIGSVFLQMIIALMLTDNRTGCRFITVDA